MTSGIYENYLLYSTSRLSLDNAGLNTSVPILAHLLLGIYAWRARTHARMCNDTDGHTAMYIQRAYAPRNALYRVKETEKLYIEVNQRVTRNASLDFRFRWATTGQQSIGGKGVFSRVCDSLSGYLTRESTGE